MPEWILTKDRMPENEDTIVVIWIDGDYEFATWADSCDRWDVFTSVCFEGGFVEPSRVDRWTPLPDEPE